jgi:short-subunit dehydrogenase involved in D-alanine esterification of teichoic acids
MAYVPFKFYPVYCATKAGIHYLAVELRSDLAGTNVNIVELVPPYVDTNLDAHCREQTIALMGGRENWHPPMPLEEYMSQAMENLAKTNEDGKPLKEVSVDSVRWELVLGEVHLDQSLSNSVSRGRPEHQRYYNLYRYPFQLRTVNIYT